PIPVRPVVHYMMGGIHTDINGRTPLEGLYACGETACVSINGANRLGSNSLSECLVFGARAGKAAGEYAREQAHPSARALAARGDDEASRIERRFLQASGKERVAELRYEMQQAMETGAGVFRNEEDLRRAADKLSEIRERASRLRLGGTTVLFNVELTAALEFDFMLDLASVIVQCALARKESRGAHARRDYPQRNDRDYLAHSLAHFSPDGPRLEPLPVVITRWQPTTRKY
ncbi:MAG: FAD-binding protein, partial [Chloroflexi bacterium]|nr:FAD-binding protein [Chloroflexota bacterium]